MSKLFIRMIIWFMQCDLEIERHRLEYIHHAIAHDQAALLDWQMRLLELE